MYGQAVRIKEDMKGAEIVALLDEAAQKFRELHKKEPSVVSLPPWVSEGVRAVVSDRFSIETQHNKYMAIVGRQAKGSRIETGLKTHDGEKSEVELHIEFLIGQLKENES
jgi:hypothetical protein